MLSVIYNRVHTGDCTETLLFNVYICIYWILKVVKFQQVLSYDERAYMRHRETKWSSAWNRRCQANTKWLMWTDTPSMIYEQIKIINEHGVSSQYTREIEYKENTPLNIFLVILFAWLKCRKSTEWDGKEWQGVLKRRNV